MLALALVGAGGACGDGDDESERARQARRAAAEAGLSDDVQDVFALAAEGIDGTFQVTYPLDDGRETVLTQEPPNLRADVLKGGTIVESRLVRGEIAYYCVPDEKKQLDCDRLGTRAGIGGSFASKAVDTVIDRLRERADRYELTVEERRLLDVDARCLIAVRREDAPPDAADAERGTACFSPEGAALLIETADSTLRATEYTTDIPDGIFDLPR